jgi:acetoin utilization deacetylase AcuC-like enzyme
MSPASAKTNAPPVPVALQLPARRGAARRPGFLERLWRRSRHGGRRARARVIFNHSYVLDIPQVDVDSLRGERIVTWLERLGLLRAEDVVDPQPVSMRTLRRVHSDAYLESLRDPAVLRSVIGFDDSPQLLDSIITLQRAMTGGTVAAVARALEEGRPAVNLGGGFHHAERERGAGFCALNDIAAAIAAQRSLGFAGRVLVVDLDLHDGEGTRSIFAHDETVFTFSLHNQHRGPTEAAASLAVEFGSGIDDRTYLDLLERHLPPILDSFRPRLVIYLAGVDLAEDDRLGDAKLTAAGLLARDQRVFALTRGAQDPPALAIVLGGGYGDEAWRYSARGLAWLLSGRRFDPPPGSDVALERYRSLVSALDPSDLSGSADWGLTQEELLSTLAGAPRETRFLGFYSRHGLELSLEQAGLLDRLRALGYTSPDIELDTGNPAGQTLRIWGDPQHRALLGELRASRDRRSMPGMELLRLEWLLLQDPRGSFVPNRRPLPGQKHPGLGLSTDVMLLLILVCDRLRLDGIVFVPSQFRLIRRVAAQARCTDPVRQGEIDALATLFRGRTPTEQDEILAAGGVRRADGSPYRWTPGPLVVPVSRRLKEHFASPSYLEAAERAARSASLVLTASA